MNNSLLVDALIVAGVNSISHSNTQNVLRSYCPLEKKSIGNITSRKLELAGETRDETVLTNHNCDCIFCECKKCGAVCFQDAIIKANLNVDWEKIVTWHRWENVEIYVPVEKQRDEDGKKEQKKKQFDKI